MYVSPINFKKAVFYAIDNETCAIATNNTTIAAKAFGSSFFPDYVKEWDEKEIYINTYDPELAKEYLGKSGYNGETLVMLSSNSEVFKNLLTIMQSFLLNVGINTEIKAVDSTIADNSIDDPTAWDIMLHRMGVGL